MAPQRCMGLMINLFLWKEIVPQRIYYLTNDLYLKCFSDSNDKVSLSNCVDNTLICVLLFRKIQTYIM